MTSQTDTRSIAVSPRPYILDFGTPGGQYPISSEEVQNLLANYPVAGFTRNRLDLRGDDGRTCSIYPATLGGGNAFSR